VEIRVRAYSSSDEAAWLRCRVIAFLDSAYYDDVRRYKETYTNPAIEVVAEVQGKLVGLLDVEYELESGSITFHGARAKPTCRGSVMHHLAVHPDFRRQRIASRLLEYALTELRQNGVRFLEAWTRDHEAACRWYERHGFRSVHTYLHVYASGTEAMALSGGEWSGFSPISVFAHYDGDQVDLVRSQFSRTHESRLYRRDISQR
jgi:ribosomal protein S18 acetylase RimI-like enzyme